MSLDQYRSRINGSVWQGLSVSGVDLSQFPADKQTQLVNSISDQVLLAVNDMLDDLPRPQSATTPASESATAEGETVLWQGKPFLSLVESYVITSERIKVSTGLLGKDLENYELIRIQDLDVTQNLTERVISIGDIRIRGADPTTPELTLRNIPHPKEVFELLRKAWLDARKKYGLVFRQEL